MENKTINEIKKKREFSGLPDSVVMRAAEMFDGDVKKSRAFLRKYFGVFLTNKILKGKKFDRMKVLKSHKSSAKRNYVKIYKEIFIGEGNFESIIDLGSGVNGLSIPEIYEASGALEYYGVEASKQVVDIMNHYFNTGLSGFGAHMIWADFFDVDIIKEIIKRASSPKAIFMLQIIDAMESFKKNFSKGFILEIANVLTARDIFVLSFSTTSLSGKNNFDANRKWLIDFLEKEFDIRKSFGIFGERFFVFRKK